MDLLEALDKAKTQWYHFTTILVAGAGFFTDAYDLFCISTITSLLGRLYYYDPSTGKPGTLPINVLAAVNATALCGTFVGNLVFGWLGDKIGRRRVYGWTLLLMIICSIGSGLSFGATAKSVMTTLCFFRFWLGFGIGGDYPVSATLMSEYSNVDHRGSFIAAVFAMQGFGILTGATFAIIVSSIFNHIHPRLPFYADPRTPPQADFVWRLIVMFGAVPAATTLYYRLRLPETARYTALVEGDLKKAAQDMFLSGIVDVQYPSSPPVDPEDGGGNRIQMMRQSQAPMKLWSMEYTSRHGWQLLGTAITWLLVDVSFYSQNLFQKDILVAVGWLPPAREMSAVEELFRISRAAAFITLFATIPGYWVTVLTIEWLGRRVVQIQGFFFMTLFMIIIALKFKDLRGHKCPTDPDRYCGGNHAGFLLLYAVIFFFANFGPNSTTFIIPAELFPAGLRSTSFGISAASGKLGAIVGAFGFLYARQATSKQDQDALPAYPKGVGVRNSFLMLAAISFLGFLFSIWLTPETRGQSLEALSHDFSYRNVPTEEQHPEKGPVVEKGLLVEKKGRMDLRAEKLPKRTTMV